MDLILLHLAHPSFQENHSFFGYFYRYLFWMFVDQYAILFSHEEFLKLILQYTKEVE